MTNVSLTEAKVEASKQSKATKNVVFSVITSTEDPEGFDVVEGDHPESQLTYLNGSKRSNGPVEKEEKTEPVKKSSTTKTKSEPVMKAKAKKATKKAAKSTGKRGPDQPLGWIIEMVQEKKKVAKADIRKALEKADYSKATVNVQMTRLKNSPLLKVEGDNVIAKK